MAITLKKLFSAYYWNKYVVPGNLKKFELIFCSLSIVMGSLLLGMNAMTPKSKPLEILKGFYVVLLLIRCLMSVPIYVVLRNQEPRIRNKRFAKLIFCFVFAIIMTLVSTFRYSAIAMEFLLVLDHAFNCILDAAVPDLN